MDYIMFACDICLYEYTFFFYHNRLRDCLFMCPQLVLGMAYWFHASE